MSRLRSMAVLAALAATTPAQADPDQIAKARAAIDAVDYAAAKLALDAALKSGTNRPVDLVEIYRLRGTVAGALDDVAGAADAFAHMLALDPSVDFPSGTSPKITEPFAAASKRLAGRSLTITHLQRSDPPAVTLVITNDPLGMVASASVSLRADGKETPWRTKTGSKQIEIELPLRPRHEVKLSALDANGNTLAVIPAIVVETSARLVPPITRPSADERLVTRWYIYAIPAAVFVAAGTYLGIVARSDARELDAIIDDSTNHTRSEADAIEERGRRHALAANVLLLSGGVLAITSGVLFGLQRSGVDRRPRVGTAPVRGGGAVTLEMRF